MKNKKDKENNEVKITITENNFEYDKKQNKKKKKPKDEDENIINMADIRKQRNKIKRIKLLKKLLVILIIIALGLIAYLTKDMWVYKLEGILDRKTETIVNDGETQKGNFPIEINSSAVNAIDVLGNNVVTADESQIYIYDENGSKVNSFIHNLGSPIVKVAGKKILAFDNGGKSFKVYNKSEECYSKNLKDNKILLAEISQTGYVAVVVSTEKYPACMIVYDRNGSEIYRWSSAHRIMDISFDGNSNGCYISTFNSENGIIQSVVHYVTFDSTEEQMKSTKLNTLVLDTFENNNGDIWAVGDNKFYKLNGNGEILLEYEYSNDLVSYDLNEYSAAISVKNGRNGSMTAIFDSDSDDDKPRIVQSDNGMPKKVLLSKNMVLVLSDRIVESYDLKGNCTAKADVSPEYTNFSYLNDSVYFLGYREINKIEFKN